MSTPGIESSQDEITDRRASRCLLPVRKMLSRDLEYINKQTKRHKSKLLEVRTTNSEMKKIHCMILMADKILQNKECFLEDKGIENTQMKYRGKIIIT